LLWLYTHRWRYMQTTLVYITLFIIQSVSTACLVRAYYYSCVLVGRYNMNIVVQLVDADSSSYIWRCLFYAFSTNAPLNRVSRSVLFSVDNTVFNCCRDLFSFLFKCLFLRIAWICTRSCCSAVNDPDCIIWYYVYLPNKLYI